MKFLVGISLILLASSTVYFAEEFGRDWDSKWLQFPREGFGEFKLSPGKWYVDPVADLGIQTSTNLRLYAISRKFASFTHTNTPLVIQFTVKHEQSLECGGGYLKVLPEGFDQEHFDGKTPYLVMFGPDICGSERKTLVLLPYKGKNFINIKKIKAEIDNFTHQYTLIISPDNTFEVLIDNKQVAYGDIEENFEILSAKEIDDPNDVKPEDWIDNPTIPDPNDKKPSNWDVPEFIYDNDIPKPEDWDDTTDGEYKPPKRRNPDYKGPWVQKKIPNPDYKGPWKAKKIRNPNYEKDPNLYQIGTAGGVGIEIWQVNAGTVFDNIFIGNNRDEALEFSKRTFSHRLENEKKAKHEFEENEAKMEKNLKNEDFEEFENFGGNRDDL